MAKDVQDTVRGVIRALEGGNNGRGKSGGNPLSGVKGIAAGAGAAALVPLAVKGAGRLVKGMDGVGNVISAPKDALSDVTGKLGDTVGGGIGDKVSDKVDEAGGPSGILKGTVKDALPFGGDDDDEQGGGNSKGGAPGAGKGRRMPIQQSVDIGVNIETVYNQFTQFEEWPNFMHRVTRVTQDDETTVKFAAKIWAKTKEFTANIETQRPDERIKWKVSEGITHTGVVTFHELGPHLTRVLLTMDVEPGGILEKAARGMRHIKRAARGDLHRFKGFIELTEQETGAWRGVIEDGEVVEDHDPSYDESREYADPEEVLGQQDEDEDEDEDEENDESEGEESDDDENEGEENDDDDENEGDDEEESQQSQRGGSRSRSTSARSQSRSTGGSSRSSGSRSGSSRSGSGSSRSGSGSGSSRSSSGSSRSGSGSGSSRSSGSGSSRSSSGSSRSSSGSSRSSSGSSRSSGSGSRSGSSRSRNGHSGSSGRSRAGASSGGQTGRRQSRSRNGNSE